MKEKFIMKEPYKKSARAHSLLLAKSQQKCTASGKLFQILTKFISKTFPK